MPTPIVSFLLTDVGNLGTLEISESNQTLKIGEVLENWQIQSRGPKKQHPPWQATTCPANVEERIIHYNTEIYNSLINASLPLVWVPNEPHY